MRRGERSLANDKRSKGGLIFGGEDSGTTEGKTRRLKKKKDDNYIRRDIS